jgi:PPOX class probable F420-dependent enzyme
VSVSTLARERYISLTTRKRDGTTASTPVWVVSDDGRRLLVWTGADTWKARRIRRDPHVLVAASDARGREKGPRFEARARFVDEGELVTTLLRRKYPVQKRALDGFTRVMRALTRKPPARSVYVEIVDGAQQQV